MTSYIFLDIFLLDGARSGIFFTNLHDVNIFYLTCWMKSSSGIFPLTKLDIVVFLIHGVDQVGFSPKSKQPFYNGN